MTHDIKGHLAAIQSCHYVVLHESLGPLTVRQRDFVERAYKRTAYLTNFVRTLLRLTELRLSNRPETAIVPLNEVIVHTRPAPRGEGGKEVYFNSGVDHRRAGTTIKGLQAK